MAPQPSAALSLAELCFQELAKAADDSDCCSNLEDRIANLESMANKGNEKVLVTVSGWMAKSGTWWSDGGGKILSSLRDKSPINRSRESPLERLAADQMQGRSNPVTWPRWSPVSTATTERSAPRTGGSSVQHGRDMQR